MQCITCYFNPAGYKRRLINYRRFRDSFSVPLTTVELSFDGKFEIEDAIHIKGGPENLMWQKEALLNIAIKRLPDHVDKVAWLDNDIIFMNPDWYQQAIDKLEEYPVVQLFSESIHLDKRNNFLEMIKGESNDTLKLGEFGHMGFAWSARREVFEYGIYDAAIVGGGDNIMRICWRGLLKNYIFKRKLTSKNLLHCLEYHNNVYPFIKGNIGFLDGSIVHIFHGTRENRAYDDRWDFLTDHNFDPYEDIIKDQNGLWKWNSDKPKLHKRIKEYFYERREDD